MHISGFLIMEILFTFTCEQMGIECRSCFACRCLRYFCVFSSLASIHSKSIYSVGNLLPQHDSCRNRSECSQFCFVYHHLLAGVGISLSIICERHYNRCNFFNCFYSLALLKMLGWLETELQMRRGMTSNDRRDRLWTETGTNASFSIKFQMDGSLYVKLNSMYLCGVSLLSMDIL